MGAPTKCPEISHHIGKQGSIPEWIGQKKSKVIVYHYNGLSHKVQSPKRNSGSERALRRPNSSIPYHRGP